MKTFSKIVGIFFWLVGFAVIVYVVREALFLSAGHNSLIPLIGLFIFHAVFMFVGGFFFRKGVQKAPGEIQKNPTAS
jgi:lipopolysaccharide export LptBFGC system permease protein LptF